MIRHKEGENPDLVNGLKLYKDQAVMPQTSSTRDHIYSALQERFFPQSLEVIDESDLHIGHAGHTGAGSSHFSVKIVSESFRGMQRLERHRKIYEALEYFLENGVHALKIKAFTLDEL
jgi:BolA protein